MAAFAGGDDEDTGSSEFKALERRVEVLETWLGQPRRPGIVPVPSPRLRGRQIPKDWLPREFNGMRYYIIPIDSDPNGHTGQVAGEASRRDAFPSFMYAGEVLRAWPIVRPAGGGIESAGRHTQ